jgi:hypothetical protein
MFRYLARDEVVLFLAEESLLFQVAAWVRTHGRYSLRLVMSSDPQVTARAADDAALAIIDATCRPGEALAILERELRCLGPQRLFVYSEQMHDGLELFVRVRGVTLLMGPMAAVEWEGALAPLAALTMRPDRNP